MSDVDQEEMLRLLTAHGQEFLNSFPESSITTTKRKRDSYEPEDAFSEEEDTEEEWGGIGHDESDASAAEESGSEIEDDGFVGATTTSGSGPEVIVFSGNVGKLDKASMPMSKAFMSSRVSKQRLDVQEESSTAKTPADETESSHAQNDAILHKLVHTKLLSGPSAMLADQKPAQRRKDLQGRVLELAGSAKLGRGERAVRNTERDKASRQVRDGLIRKQKQREAARVEEAKNLGNYHRTLKSVYEPKDDQQPSAKKRERGLGMGIGRFRGGILTIGKDDLSRMQNARSSSRGSSNRGGGRGGRGRGGRGGSRGRGRGG